jgi:hypothetical protein
MESKTEVSNFDIRDVDTILDEYEVKVGVPQVDFNKLSSINNYVNMSLQEIEHLSPEDSANIAFVFKQHSLNVQKLLNREASRISYCKTTIDKIICHDVANYHGSWEMARMQAIKTNDVAIKLAKIEHAAKLRVDRLTFIGKSLSDLADVLLKIQGVKRGHN